MSRVALVTASTLVGLAVTAGAEPPRYPKPPVDAERESEARSSLWEAATHPERAPYAAAVLQAQRRLDQRDFSGAVAVATQAIDLVPRSPVAYEIRGRANLGLRAYAACADDLGAALARAHEGRPRSKDLRRTLGVCQAHAGRLSDAEATLADAAAVAPHDRDAWELWMRLGEVRVALGKLDEALAAFDTSIAESQTIQQAPAPQALWLRAGAYDRARQPGKAEDDVRAALAGDRSMSQIDNGVLPLLGAGEREFLFGVAWQYSDQVDRPRLESALLYFRQFVAAAPTSPWRHRADEHLRELSAVALPARVQRVSGNAPVDTDVATAAVRAAMPKLRACLGRLPGTMIEVRLTRVGPRAPVAPPPKPRPIGRGVVQVSHPPPAGVTTTPQLGGDAPAGVLEAATRCLESGADAVALPAVKDVEQYYQLAFSVIGP